MIADTLGRLIHNLTFVSMCQPNWTKTFVIMNQTEKSGLWRLHVEDLKYLKTESQSL